ncbi:MAG: hypothetical protein AAFZ92_00680 [Pseudomonadota bacterium]
MIPSLLLIIAVTALIYAIRQIGKQPPGARKKLLIQYGLYLLAAVILLLTITGRVHWVGAAIAILLAGVQKLLLLAPRLFPFLHIWLNRKSRSTANTQQHSGKMTVDQAKDVFGMDTVDSVEQITRRHRELMQKMHPDRGGSDYIAAQINQAKDILIEHVKHS